MRKEFLPFTRPAINEDDIAAVNNVLRSGWITNGPENAAFEAAMAEYTGAKHAVALSSATAAMHLLLLALGIGPGDEVITPSMTWVSIANMIELTGAKPVFVDINRETMLVEAEAVKAAITPRTKLIVPVHYTGAALDLDAIYAVAGDIPVVEDAAHALGTFYKGRHIGGKHHAIYSFHAIKNITCAEGGMFVTDDEELAASIRRWKFHGIGVDAFDRQNRGRSPQAEVIAPGFKYNLTDISAALGLSQLKRVDEINSMRRELAMLYREKLSGVDELRPLADPDYDFVHAWHLFVARVDSPAIDRNTFMAKLKELNIGSGLHFRSVHSQKYYREKYHIAPGTLLPNTDYNSDRILSLPLFPGMTEEDVNDVVEAAKTVFASL